MFYFHLFLSVFRKAYFRFFVSLNPLIKIFLLPSPSLPPSSLPPFLPLSLPSCLFFFFPFQASRFSLFQKSCCTQCLRSDLCLLPSAPGAADARPTAAAARSWSLRSCSFTRHLPLFPRIVAPRALYFGGPPPPRRPPLSGTGNPLPGPPGTCLSVSLEGGAGAWAGRECGGPILTPALPRGAAGRSTASPKTSFLSLSHAFIHSFVHSPLTDIY